VVGPVKTERRRGEMGGGKVVGGQEWGGEGEGEETGNDRVQRVG